MGVRTYYWNSRKTSLHRYYKNKILNKQKKVFRYGNAGDIFNVDLIKYVYNLPCHNILDEGKRFLAVGSIMNVLKEGDIINGIGWKGNDIDLNNLIESIKIYGVRGPLTKDFLEKKGADLSQLKFQYDPGLLINTIYEFRKDIRPKNDIIFIPHYKDKWIYKEYPKNVKVVSIDNKPKRIAEEILNAKLIYSSSLHGIIFAHALGKECVYVKPQSDEPLLKYKDYFLSVNITPPNPLGNINAMDLKNDTSTYLDKEITLKDFWFPDKAELVSSGIIY